MAPQQKAMPCRFGCDVFLENLPRWVFEKRVGVLTNQASVTGDFVHVVDALESRGARVTALFSPQHGFYAEKQANMVESDHSRHKVYQVPIYSLYGETRKPTEAMLRAIDVLIVDLQDVGTRVYTYGTTVGLCVEALCRRSKPVVVLDRPNPIGGDRVEGNRVQPAYRSFVGRYSLPMRHGLTLGELALWVAQRQGRPEMVKVVPVQGWARENLWPATGHPWIFPSPNMPSWETALVYPGMVLLEGTNLSEGRGTTLPFQVVGALYLDTDAVHAELDPWASQGIVVRPVAFEPTFDKWRGRLCRGFHLHVTDAGVFCPYRFGLAFLRAVLRVHRGAFQWLEPPYEYETRHRPIDILTGDPRIRPYLENGGPIMALEEEWGRELREYEAERRGVLLYGEECVEGQRTTDWSAL
ncbi:exo-beta-N-acetylmuramidase NamZ family protein [Desulfosoma sp.]|uniref:exo-beta-N-acetylmuramidase NamZ family protein n=1 Tax=Desulfosoma sp. TaxID=2603217 RepID=UPI00404997B0